MNLWSALTTWLRGKAAPSSYGSGSSGGPSFPIDAFRKHRAPTPTELLGEAIGTAYACATLNADLLSSTRLGLYQTTGRGDPQSKLSKRGDTHEVDAKTLRRLKAAPPAGSKVRKARQIEEVLDHPALDLLNRPNPHADGVGLSLFELFNFTQLYQEYIGRAYWYCERDGLGGTPSVIWILASQNVREVCDGSTDRIIDHYEFAGRDRYTPDQIVPFRMPDLRNPYVGGVSPLRAVIEQVRIARKLDAHTGALLDNMARPDGLFIPKGSADGFDMGTTEAARLEAAINKRFRTAGRGGIMVAEHDGQLVPLQWPTRDLMEAKQLELTKTMIANAFGVPGTKLDRNDANLAGAQTGDYAHAKDAGVPRCKRNEAALNAFFLPMWDPTGRLFFAYDSPVPEDRAEAREDRKVQVAAGAVTRNELREDAGLDPRDDMEAPTLPSNVVGVDEGGKPLPAAPSSAINLHMPGRGGDPNNPDDPNALDPKPPEHQADAVASNDLKATVGGSQAVMALQEAFYAGQMPRDAAVANATLVFGFTPEQAEELFPDKQPENKPEPEPEPVTPPATGGGDSGNSGGQKVLKSSRGKAADGGVETGNVGTDGLAGPLPQGDGIEAALKSIFAQQRKAVLKELAGKSVEDVESEFAARVRTAIGPAMSKSHWAYVEEGVHVDVDGLHAFLRVAGRKNEPAKPNPGLLPTTFVDLSDWDDTIDAAVRPLVEVIVTKGAQETIARVGASADVFKVVEKNIPAAVEKLSLKFAAATNATTSQEITEALGQLRDELTAGLVEGDTRVEMTKRVKGVFDRAEDSRAAMIAKTEASRAQHAGEQMSAKESGVVTRVKWLRSADCCPLCNEVAEQNPDGIPLGDAFAVTKYGPVEHPPLHPNCFPGETPVLAVGAHKGLAGRYRGPVVRLVFAGGKQLTVTPNHNLLTPMGFARAASLREGDHCLHYPGFDRVLGGVPDDHGQPARIDQVVASLAESLGVTAHRVPVAPEHLHGDAAFVEGHIDVVAAHRPLPDGREPAGEQPVVNEPLAATHLAGVGFVEGGDLPAVLLALRDATDGGVGPRREALAFRGRRAGHACGVGKGGGADFDAGLDEQPAQERAADADHLGECLNGLAGVVSPLQVIKIEHDVFDGHVYDLQTASSLYLANGLVVSNCQCSETFVIDEPPAQ